MELTTIQQTTAFLWAFVLGAVIAAVYFIYSVIREVFMSGKVTVFFADMLFMIFVFVLNFLFAVGTTEGKVRLYVIMSEIIVFILLYLLIGRRIKNTAFRIIRRIKEDIGEKYSKFTKKRHKNHNNNVHLKKNSCKI